MNASPITLIHEGAYPFEVGGVSRHIETLVKACSNQSFNLLTLAQSRPLFGFGKSKNFSLIESYNLFRTTEVPFLDFTYNSLNKLILQFVELLFVGADEKALKLKFQEIRQVQTSVAVSCISKSEVNAYIQLCRQYYPTIGVQDINQLISCLVLPVRKALLKPIEYKQTHVFSLGLASLLAFKSTESFKSVILDIHGDFISELKFHQKMSPLVVNIYSRLVSFNLSLAHKTVFRGSREHFNEVLKVRPKVQPLRINNISMTDFTPPKLSAAYRVSYVGRLSKEKDILSVLKVYKEFCTVSPVHTQLNLIVPKGFDCDYFNEVNEFILRHNIKNVSFFIGLKQHEIYKNTDVLLLLSDFENQPLVILEAAGLKIPVICNALESLKELIPSKAYQDSLFVDKRNTADAVESLRLLTDFNSRKKYGELLGVTLKNQLNGEQFKKNYLSLYSSIL